MKKRLTLVVVLFAYVAAASGAPNLIEQFKASVWGVMMEMQDAAEAQQAQRQEDNDRQWEDDSVAYR